MKASTSFLYNFVDVVAHVVLASPVGLRSDIRLCLIHSVVDTNVPLAKDNDPAFRFRLVEQMFNRVVRREKELS